MLGQFRQVRGEYPRQFWWLVWGSLLSSTGAALIWPFMSIYLRERLEIPLATVAGLMTLSSVMGLLASLVVGPLVDRVGRKGAMVFSLAMSAIYYLLMTQTRTLPVYAALIGVSGAFSPLYSVGANAMIADLIPQQRRTDAYALLRMVHNVGVAVGPILGGVLASVSYTLAFCVAATAYALFAVLILMATRETLPVGESARAIRGGQAGWGPVLRDRLFLAFVGSFAVTNMVAAIMFMLLPVYAKEQFALPESRYGLVVTTNALMCIFVQYSVTQVTKRHPPLLMLVVGALFYAVGVGSVALGSGLWGFIASMVVMTTGEL
ncbi:MAG: MFS transporter, partial [Chloroflexi bacterium]|nr:MFS transporter [Chloroflexota bacterium]